MVKKIQQSNLTSKMLWIGVAIFAIGGLLPWFVVNFPIGNLKISIIDLLSYFADSKGVTIDFYSTFIYALLATGWIFGLLFLIVASASKRSRLVLFAALISIVPGVVWALIAPYLRVQMIFLSLANQPIDANQTMGSGQIAAIIAGVVLLYCYIRLKI